MHAFRRRAETPSARPGRASDGANHTTVFAVFEERRAILAAQRFRVVDQLHAPLRDLVPRGAAFAITRKSASTMPPSRRPALPSKNPQGPPQELVRDQRALDGALADVGQRMSAVAVTQV